MRRRTLLLATLTAALSGCALRRWGTDAQDAVIEVQFIGITIAGPSGGRRYRVSGTQLAISSITFGPTSPTPEPTRTLTLTADQRSRIAHLADQALQQGTIDTGCTDSPEATISATWPDGRLQQARIGYCGSEAPASSALGELVAFLTTL